MPDIRENYLGSFKLVKPDFDDWKLVLDIRNLPEVRRHCLINTLVIPKDEHLNFWRIHSTEYKIIVVCGEKVGYFRKEPDGRVSIGIKRDFRGLGIGTAILRDETGYATVANQNVASHKAFKRALWFPVGILYQSNYAEGGKYWKKPKYD